MNPLSGNNNNDDKTPQPPTTSSSLSLLLPWQQQPQKPAQSRVQPPLTTAATAAAAIESAFSAAALGCCVSHLIIRPNLYKTLQEECEFIWNKFQSYLQTSDFDEFCKMEGIIDPSITLLCQKSSSSLWEAFQTQVIKDATAAGNTSIQLGVVFHGTAKNNIPSILKSGLDPKLRIGQAYGVGEYFSKNPSTSLSYCKGDNQMLVYCVVIPTASTLSSSSSTSSAVFASKFHIQNNKPQDIVVVEKSQHQVPIAVLEFSGASAAAIQRSASIRYQLQQLHKQVQQAEMATNEIKCKAQIIQLLFANELQGAAHKFRTNAALFSDITKLEISYWAHQHADAEVVQFYFNHSFENEDYNNNASESSSSSLSLLPPPPPDGWNTFQNDIVSVEAQQIKLQQAWNNVKECQDKLKAEMDKNINNNSSSSGTSSTPNNASTSTTMFTFLRSKMIARASRPLGGSTDSLSTRPISGNSSCSTTTTSCSRKRPEEETSNDDNDDLADGRVLAAVKKSTTATSFRPTTSTTTTTTSTTSTSWSNMFRDDDNMSMVALSSLSSPKSSFDANKKSDEADVAIVDVDTNQEDGSK